MIYIRNARVGLESSGNALHCSSGLKSTLRDVSAFGCTPGQFGHICPQPQPPWPLVLLSREDASLQGSL